MDLKELRDDAIAECNKELREEKEDLFQNTVKTLIREISDNNTKIEHLQKRNADIRLSITSLSVPEVKAVEL